MPTVKPLNILPSNAPLARYPRDIGSTAARTRPVVRATSAAILVLLRGWHRNRPRGRRGGHPPRTNAVRLPHATDTNPRGPDQSGIGGRGRSRPGRRSAWPAPAPARRCGPRVQCTQPDPEAGASSSSGRPARARSRLGSAAWPRPEERGRGAADRWPAPRSGAGRVGRSRHPERPPDWVRDEDFRWKLCRPRVMRFTWSAVIQIAGIPQRKIAV